MMGGETDDVARMLIDEHRRGARFRPFAAATGIANLDQAYEVQRSHVGLQMRDRHTTAVGYKVGLTSPRMQEMCKIDRPGLSWATESISPEPWCRRAITDGSAWNLSSRCA
jgi:2-keto-4-pentenoate hydratase